MRAVTLKGIAAVAVLVVGGLGASLAVRSQRPPDRSLASSRSGGARPGRPLTIAPDRVPSRVARVAAPPLQGALPRAGGAASILADPWEPSVPARPVTARPPRSRPHASSVTARPRSSGLRLPATLSASSAGRPITARPARAVQTAAPRVPPVTSPGRLGFREEPGEQRNPELTLVNCESDTMVVTFTGQRRYRRVLSPRATVVLQIEPGVYEVRVRATRSSPNSGVGEFREYHRYSARWMSVPTGQARPLRLGELSPEAGEEAEKPEPLVKPVPEQP